MKNVIRIGDPTSHGGVVTSGDDSFLVDGRAIARVGDTCTCPLAGHQACVIVEGDAGFVVGGRAVALDGHKTSCGAILRATTTNFASD
ncbi:PAAR domain-containing protein [Burkholderia stagnalis]|uniref:PAAR domain-containing protein n=1 Tax=Burkholderia stagnalis TaxID=1503054 RepID=A0A104V3S8_9BURK|nr:PAAR domain-containing protein [Burkholderia stagnalis]AOK57483.1 hypothetical protein WT74_24455 [Burkholderia stagnalis]KAB0641355.1 PAAR domain-containing protein [Burkholderia stagnalis]KVD91093.1 hypothetical protein WS63_12280 [Burkholderia stagnalis]KVL90941.1 hypothetical protein WT02_22370 [Burkholderia stagnalis]KVL94474.1 hypothetical protein WT03_15685 [Burkholderia stagnalis]